MIPVNPTDDMPSCAEEACDLGGCSEPWAWETECRNGSRKLRLCEEHATEWLQCERDLEAEREEMRGRPSLAPLFGLARALDGRTKRTA